MPTYPYKCSENPEHEHQMTRSITEEEPETQICVEEGCEGRLIRVFTAPPINFKGQGFSTSQSWR
jgi:predicted nucleic acid-binding Zn ribbon protein